MRLSSPRWAVLVAAAMAGLVVLSGCSAPAAPSAATHSPSATPTPEAPTLDFPTGSVPGQVAYASVDNVSSVPTIGSTAGPGLLVGGKVLVIEGDCVGPSGGGFRLTTADNAARVIAAGTLTCGQPLRDELRGVSDYEGPVQLSFTETDGIQLGWLRAALEPAD